MILSSDNLACKKRLIIVPSVILSLYKYILRIKKTWIQEMNSHKDWYKWHHFIIVPTIYHILALYYMFKFNSWDIYKGWLGPWGVYGTIDNHNKNKKKIGKWILLQNSDNFSYKSMILSKRLEENSSRLWHTWYILGDTDVVNIILRNKLNYNLNGIQSRGGHVVSTRHHCG